MDNFSELPPFKYSEGLLDVPSDATVHTSNPAVELLHALYFHLA
jgi:redox-sensing transcriptional repressor